MDDLPAGLPDPGIKLAWSGKHTKEGPLKIWILNGCLTEGSQQPRFNRPIIKALYDLKYSHFARRRLF